MDISDSLARETQDRLANPECITVLVLTDDPIVAMAVGPMLARRLYPERKFGVALHCEPVAGGYEVAVRDHGIDHATTKGVVPAPS